MAVPKNFVKFTGNTDNGEKKNVEKDHISVFPSKFCEAFQNSLFIKPHRTIVSVLKQEYWRANIFG